MVSEKEKGIGKQDPDAGLMKGKGKTKNQFIREWSPHRIENFHHLPIYGPAPVPDDDGLENVLVHVGTIRGDWLWSGIVPEHILAIELEGIVRRALTPHMSVLQSFTLAYQWGQKGPYPSGTRHAGTTRIGVNIRDVEGAQRSPDRQVWFTGIFLPLDSPRGPPHAYTRNKQLQVTL